MDLEPGSKGYVKGGEKDEIKCLFNRFVSVFLKEICGSHCVRPLPPMLGNGQSVDLFKLYSVVREKGGYEVVSENGLWDSVAKVSGLDSGVAPALKLIYAKYLDTLDKWMQRTVKDRDSKGGFEDSETIQSVFMMDLESVSKGFSSENSEQEKKDGEHLQLDLEESKLNFTSGGKMCNGGQVGSFVGLDEPKKNCSDKHFESSVVGDCGSRRKKCKNNEVQSFVQLDGNKKNDNDERIADVEEHDIDVKSVVKEDGCNRKRKRECYLSLLDWVRMVAKDPCDPALGSLPERLKWKSFGNEQQWKQVLLARDVMLLKRNSDSSTEKSIWQKKQKMHPTMYEDHSGSEISRFSRRIRTAKESRAILSLKKSQARACSESSSSGTQSDLEDLYDKQSDSQTADVLNGLWINNHSRKRIPMGPNFQAKVPEWNGETYESDSKWLGTHVWPQEKGVNCNKLIERDRIGFGRHDLCGCEFQGSFECVKFHVEGKRFKVKLELGMAFYHWHIDKMGEEVALSWAQAEEKKFESIVKSNPPSQEKCFWDEICKLFPYKRREQLVSYYFNVFLLRRRGQQNRSTPIEINSDDEEPEFGSAATNCIGQGSMNSPGSIYCSPKKTHLNFREYSKMD